MISRTRPVPLRARLLGLVATFGAVVASSSAPGLLAASPTPVRAPHGIVVSAEPRASLIGLEVLRKGGNAVDAAVAVALALAVTYPEAGNLGGGGFLMFRQPGPKWLALDFRETAPKRATAGDYLDPAGKVLPERSLRGGAAVAVPGSVAGLWEAHRRWGKTAWGKLVEPAERLARDGVPFTRREATVLAEEASRIQADPDARQIFLPRGSLLREGEILVQRDLARTLRRIRTRGAAGFYEGVVARAIVAAVRSAGGVMDEADLRSYRPVLREPLEGTYRGHRIATFPPPGGGLVLLQSLGMLERYDLGASGFASSRTIHWMVEAQRRAFADRSRWLGDPSFFSVPVSRLLDPTYLASRAATIRDDRATPSQVLGSDDLPSVSGETTHFATADADGNVVALTTTLNSSFGAAFIAPSTGVLLNNEMDDFALSPGVPNQFGLTGSAANAVAPGKRPSSSMCPTVVEPRGGGARPLLVLGSPGGSTIPSSVLQVLVNVVDHGMDVQEAVDAPRFHHQWLPDRIDHEARAISKDVADGLEARGHILRPRPPIGNVPAIGLGPDGAWLGAVDPRRGGLAAGN